MSSQPFNQPTEINPYAVTTANPHMVPADYSNAIFQSGNLLILHKTAILPDRCVKSNEPTEHRLRRNLIWHHPLVYLVILVNLIIYVIVAMIVRKTAVLQIPLAKRYKSKRIRNMLIAWGMVFAGVGSLIIGAVISTPQQPAIPLFLLCPILLIGGALFGIFGCRVVYAKKIDDHFVWLAGTCDEFRAQFPSWPYAQ